MTNCLGPLLAALVAASALAAASPAGAGPRDGRLDIYWVDVEGGAATLIVTPSGESVLVDSGNPGRRDAHRIFDVAVKTAAVEKIDHLITTHYHRDHFGGAATLATIMPIGNVYDNGEFEGGVERPDREYLEFNSRRRVVLSPGDEVPLEQAAGAAPLSLRCLAARQQFVQPPDDAAVNQQLCAEFRPKDRDGSDNANSIVLLLSFGSFRLFDGGDLTWNMEHKLVCPVNLVGQVDVYQVTHHGLDASNNPVLVRSLSPTVAVMNNGVTKGCEPETFATLKSVASIEAIYQVHRNLRPDSDNNTESQYIANSAEHCRGEYIKLSVDPAGARYTLTVPATGHERSYQVK